MGSKRALVASIAIVAGISAFGSPTFAEALNDSELNENFVGKTFYGTTTSGNCSYARYNAPDGKYHLSLNCNGDIRDIKGTYTIGDGQLCSISMSRGNMVKRCSEVERDGDGFKSPTSAISKIADGNPEGLKP